MAGLSFEQGTGSNADANRAFKQQLNKVYGWYTGGFIAFVLVLAVLEQMGLPRPCIGYLFLAATVLLYAGIGVITCVAVGWLASLVLPSEAKSIEGLTVYSVSTGDSAR